MKTVLTRDFLALILSVAVVGLGSGATLPLTALALTDAGYGSAIVGLLTAAQALGGLAVVPLTAWFAARFGSRGVIVVAVLCVAAATALMQLSTNLWLWALLRMLCGAALMLLFTIGEAWVNDLADDANRGRVVAIYATTFTLFQMSGPVLVSQIAGFTAWRFALCGALFLIALPMLAAIRATPLQAHHDEPHGRWRHVLPRMPALIVATGFFALFDTLALSLLPLFAMGHHIDRETAVLFASVVLLGDTTMQFPIGWLADRLGRERVHALMGVIVAVLLPLLPFAIATPWLRWPLLFVLGAAAGSIYTLAIVACGERFEGVALVSASAVVSASWSAASFGGPIVTGALMEHAGRDAMLWVLFAGALVFLGALRWERARGIARARA
ncbi:MFS transporter [Paraburkholderia acidisoli]|uniref:MFS transporter n=1 Tax=Paraburkholderia acidisoli TaxID=2571748 RepID=A0A7Z2GFV7_9BURK|nr:MFS transporter [Paraburkholderia acidisoli]QGZ60734.1 MFS transporter [Paraburkholderia acidisoli]